ncbi:MAG: hypothetical protein R2755_23010 [Acidimicrobiales bacterium]
MQELLLVNWAVAEQLLESDTDVQDHLPRAADFDLPDWVVVRDHATDGYQGVLLDVSFRDPGELNQRLNLLHQFLASTVGSVATSQVELQELDDGWQFTMFTKDLAEVPGPAGTDPSGYADQYHDAELTIVVELPGLITAHNADEQVGNRLVWRLSARAADPALRPHVHQQRVAGLGPHRHRPAGGHRGGHPGRRRRVRRRRRGATPPHRPRGRRRGGLGPPGRPGARRRATAAAAVARQPAHRAAGARAATARPATQRGRAIASAPMGTDTVGGADDEEHPAREALDALFRADPTPAAWA